MVHSSLKSADTSASCQCIDMLVFLEFLKVLMLEYYDLDCGNFPLRPAKYVATMTGQKLQGLDRRDDLTKICQQLFEAPAPANQGILLLNFPLS